MRLYFNGSRSEALEGRVLLIFRTSGWFVEARTEGLYSGSRVGVLHIAGVRALARSVV